MISDQELLNALWQDDAEATYVRVHERLQEVMPPSNLRQVQARRAEIITNSLAADKRDQDQAMYESSWASYDVPHDLRWRLEWMRVTPSDLTHEQARRRLFPTKSTRKRIEAVLAQQMQL